MESQLKGGNAGPPRRRAQPFMALALAAIGLAACNQPATTASAPAPAETKSAGQSIVDEVGEFLARPEELASVPANDIVKSLRLNETAMKLGATVFAKNCAVCHGEDMKGIPAQHTPDLTDNVWRYSGDDVESGGVVKYPSDVEWTVRYGIRSGHENARGSEADMLAYDPQYRTPEDTKEFGPTRFLNADEIEDVVEYVLKLGAQKFDAARAARGAVLFQDNAKGNCFDCHAEDGTGILAFGSTDLTRTNLYLFGSDRASIVESITRGRHGVMPSFEGKLKPEEVKAVSVFVWSRARK